MCSDIWWHTYIKAVVQDKTKALYGHDFSEKDALIRRFVGFVHQFNGKVQDVSTCFLLDSADDGLLN